jgi:hypothetical protein
MNSNNPFINNTVKLNVKLNLTISSITKIKQAATRNKRYCLIKDFMIPFDVALKKKAILQIIIEMK